MKIQCKNKPAFSKMIIKPKYQGEEEEGEGEGDTYTVATDTDWSSESW
jgi:hypothetical protein